MHVQITRIDEAKNDLVLSEKEAWAVTMEIGPIAELPVSVTGFHIYKIESIYKMREEIKQNQEYRQG
ncbi:hypothetical protein D8674_004417 [Pyrus ussuriensis x Pyrus communis]|uniref:Uncharacterized protein n=1 Tax=Pyrus ussuriensis x Pyrus communis TaxID=2448454 RepID=A0A5N5FQ85_9ROSA|nr:hypothetical protein D8674_004417 [Pyrus ussuriensis x Pyrus communis]